MGKSATSKGHPHTGILRELPCHRVSLPYGIGRTTMGKLVGFLLAEPDCAKNLILFLIDKPIDTKSAYVCQQLRPNWVIAVEQHS
jgi:uncharacterized protein YydD (DUF2326 family)